MRSTRLAYATLFITLAFSICAAIFSPGCDIACDEKRARDANLPDDELQDRTFAGAVRADHAHLFSGIELKGQPIEDDLRAKRFMNLT